MVISLPTLQHEQIRSGCSITLSSGNRICIFSCSAFNFCRFHVELKMQQCLIFTKCLDRICSVKRLINSSWVRVIRYRLSEYLFYNLRSFLTKLPHFLPKTKKTIFKKIVAWSKRYPCIGLNKTVVLIVILSFHMKQKFAILSRRTLQILLLYI